MTTRTFHDGESDGLEALEALDPETIESFSDLLSAMKKTAFGGRRLGDAFEILDKMVEDPDCTVILTLSGAMTIAKMGKIICSMIDRNMVQAVVSTGALIAHGLSEAVGKTHYKYHPSMTDTELYEKGYNRVYDTLEMESNLNHVERVVSQTLKRMTPDTPISSEILTREIGKTLHDHYEGPGILKSAYEKGVPVYIPAFTDSEMGLDVSIWAMKERRQSQATPQSPDLSDQETWQILQQSRPSFNPFLDLNSYTEKLLSAKRLGIFTIGGGVPRNWAQQTPPYIDILNLRMGTQLTPPRYQYGVRICPEPDYWGGLSGCTYEEGVSWGKFVPRKEGGMFAEVLSDATVVWPLLMMGLLEKARRR
ncbi:deoxyhypusine synthase family protein [Candidatus Nitrospira allomarina]|uniref:Deoxyhypusine synthase family protein n=1 Tax=Candidatus Nitrospira allomarina TaxID=3020900 RepID=A0AA96GFI7_9BACT|nr:deoxyhypusine synthase family protein [Candidatus Nitrospira allomarina]WNM59305.1 deoxyhypusine synthase family protein [Candidatus Nitrospira allomarina]